MCIQPILAATSRFRVCQVTIGRRPSFFSHAGNANESRRSLSSVTLPVPGTETTCQFASARDRPFPWRFAVSNGVSIHTCVPRSADKMFN